MSSGVNLSPTILRTLRSVEWLLIAIVTLNCAATDTLAILPSGAFLIAFTLLSLVFPIHRPLWQRIGYVISGIFLVLFFYWLGIDFNIFLYLYIAKSCFLLDRRSAVAIAILTAIISTPIYVWALPKILQDLPLQTVISRNAQIFAFNYLGNYLAGNTFAILFSSMVIAEQKSRQQAEVLTQQVERMAIDFERTRIARDMHDSLGHTLTDLQVQLAVAQEFRQHDLDQAFQAIDLAKLLTDQCIEDVSRSLQTLRQSNFNFQQALNSLLAQVKQNPTLAVQWNVDFPPLPLLMSYHLYCILKEGLVNVQKHAQASIVHVQGQQTAEGLWLEVCDDGRGFEPHKQRTGLGLRGIEERVQLLDGYLKIQSGPDRGTQLQILVPYPAQDE